MTRIAPLDAPFDPTVDEVLARMTPHGGSPIALFRTFARNLPMIQAMHGWGSYELSARLTLSMRQRELVIDRITAHCRCEYEWGVHVAYFAERVGITSAELASLTYGDPSDDCWSDPAERALLELVDALHDTADVDDDCWASARTHFDDVQLLDVCLLAGWYHAISYAANAARVPLEDGAPRFADVARPARDAAPADSRDPERHRNAQTGRPRAEPIPTEHVSAEHLPTDLEAELAAIDQLVSRVDHAQRHELVDEFVALFRADAIWTTGHGKRLFGRDAIAEFTAQVLPGSNVEGTTTYAVELVQFIRPDVAAVKVRQRHITDNGELVAEGTPMYVIAKEHDRWLLTASQNTPVVDMSRPSDAA